MKYEIEKLPILLKRKDIVETLGLSESFFYKLIKSGSPVVVTINERQYVHRDKFLDLINSTSNNLNGEVANEKNQVSSL